MKIIITFTFLVFTFFTNTAFAISNMPPANNHSSPDISLKKLSVKIIEELTGKKFTLPQKIQLKFLKKKLSKANDEEMTDKQKDWATTSLILGLGSFVLILIPLIGFLAIPAAILAIVFGIKSLKGNSNTKGIIGVVAGGLFLLLLVAAIAIILSSGFWI